MREPYGTEGKGVMVMLNGGSSQSTGGMNAGQDYGSDRTEPWLFRVLHPMHGVS